MRYLLFVLTLTLTTLCACAQSTDSTGKKQDSASAERKQSARERRDQQLIRRMNLHQRQIFQSREAQIAQIEARPYRRADSAKWSLSMNPLSFLEIQGALGLGIGFQVSPNWQIWSETSGIFQMYNKPAQSCLGGIREILAVKYYFGLRNSFFFAGEFRYKDVYFHDVNNFNDNHNFVPVYHYTYKIEDIVFGGAVWFGGQIRISANHRWRLEPSVGWGLKGRTVVWHDVPDWYTYQKSPSKIDLIPNPVRTPERVTIYLPAAFRFFYVL